MASDSLALRRAARHEARARNYLQKSEILLNQYADPDSAGALMYEAAKQCVNAVANRRGANPGTTGGKVNVLRSVAVDEPDYPDLMWRWRHANKLHIHADREILSDEEFMASWYWTRAFIDDMLTICAAGLKTT